ncbi:Sec-independent protein translocase subunit TatA/TatB [Candidatus Palauibacter sp.]|uniref:Sec-independent protein translocase subunit TatA/TatB n=1 Tax=Candidatus Palauibacter sp. TaxID=3101350 RepID=UPI003B026801
MNMTGFGISEILLIAMLVLIVFGPRRLPEITRTIGKGIREFRKGMNEIQRELEAAGRETQWKSPPAPPKPSTASNATIAGTAAAGTAAAGTAAAAETSAASADEAEGEQGASDSEEAAGPVVEEQPPPTPRDEVDPAQEFIDPWSTDSSRPTFGPQASAEPVIAPPTTEPAPPEPPEPPKPPEAEDPTDSRNPQDPRDPK